MGEAVPHGRMVTAGERVPMAVFPASSDGGYVVSRSYGGDWMA